MEQIKIGYDKSTGLYIIPNRNYCIINGSREKIDTLYYNNTQVLITSIKPTSYQTYNSKTIITEYEKDNDGIPGYLTVEEYNKYLKELQYYGSYEDYEWLFEDLEDEIKYKRFLKDWKPITKQEEIITDYEIVFIEVPVSEYEDIQPIASMLDIDSCEKGLFRYRPKPLKYFEDYCKSLDMVWESNSYSKTPNSYNWSTSGFDYVKINGEYLFFGDNKPKGIFEKVGKYQECIDKMNQDIKFIKDNVDLFFSKRDKTPLTDIEKGSYYTNLFNIRKNIMDLKVQTKSFQDQSSLISKLNKLIESVKIE
jgi:hypothetical protein